MDEEMIKVYKSWLNDECANDVLSDLSILKLEERSYSGKYPIPRLTSWFTTNNTPYVYSKQSTPSNNFPACLEEIRLRLIKEFERNFNSCLANYYRNGNDSVSWHKDDESIFIKGSMIASISLGATRTFDMKSSEQKVSFDLAHKDLIVFDKEHKEMWLHRIKKQPKVQQPRLNLTFRILLD